ncbi:MAG TPA: type II secretion system protein [Pirellulales bacterium]|nr:type II secretion system protein [Pirellulales bacterium]
MDRRFWIQLIWRVVPDLRDGRRRAFTLIELSVVLALMGLVLAVATVSFKEPYRRAQSQYALEQVMQADRRLRDHARRFGRAADLTIDLERGVIHATEQAAERRAGKEQLALRFASAVDRVLLGRRHIAYGRANVHFSGSGRSKTYALRLRGADGVGRWLLFAGESGQVTVSEHEKEIDDIFRILHPKGTDAD